MKLNKKQKRRVQSYMDMLEFNSDVISNYYDSDRIELMEKVERVLYKGYRKEDKVTLQHLENVYHRLHKDKVEIYNPK
jgi:hypothetical protein